MPGRGAAAYFSLVELVLILTVLVALAAIVVPVIYKTSLHAKSVLCNKNLAQLGSWSSMYTKDSGGYLPAYEDGWIAPLAAMGKVKVDPNAPPTGYFQCPSQPFVGFNGQSAAATWRGSHFGINQHLASRLVAADGSPLALWAQVNRATIKDPAAKVLMGDASGGNYAGIPDRDPVIAGISRTGRSVAEAFPPQPTQPFPYHRHLGGTANFLMLDGHVEQKLTWPTITVGPGTYGYRTWHAEHAYPGSGHDLSEGSDE